MPSGRRKSEPSSAICLVGRKSPKRCRRTQSSSKKKYIRSCPRAAAIATTMNGNTPDLRWRRAPDFSVAAGTALWSWLGNQKRAGFTGGWLDWKKPTCPWAFLAARGAPSRPRVGSDQRMDRRRGRVAAGSAVRRSRTSAASQIEGFAEARESPGYRGRATLVVLCKAGQTAGAGGEECSPGQESDRCLRAGSSGIERVATSAARFAAHSDPPRLFRS